MNDVITCSGPECDRGLVAGPPLRDPLRSIGPRQAVHHRRRPQALHEAGALRRYRFATCETARPRRPCQGLCGRRHQRGSELARAQNGPASPSASRPEDARGRRRCGQECATCRTWQPEADVRQVQGPQQTGCRARCRGVLRRPSTARCREGSRQDARGPGFGITRERVRRTVRVPGERLRHVRHR